MRYVVSPDWIVNTFWGLCFSQVKEQLPEILMYGRANPESVICEGQLFVFADNRSLIAEFATDSPTHLN